MTTLLRNIRELIQVREPGTDKISGPAMKELPAIRNAFLVLRNGLIDDFGPMTDCPQTADAIIDCTGRVVLPAWCDSHTHLVYAGNRVSEFVDRINGLTYEEIASRGGGILNSAKTLNETDADVIYQESAARLIQVMKMGTGAIEIKSGYGLTPLGEIKMLRVIRRLGEAFPVAIKATFLGAHAFPADYKNKPDAYIDLLTEVILPEIAGEGLADYIDAFCETGYFSVGQTIRIMEAGKKYGLRAKIHVNQFNSIGGVQAAVQANALTVDHLEILTSDDLKALKNGQTMPVALPGCSFFLSIPYTPARQIIDAGLPLAIATDFNPGSAPSGNMNFAVSAACIKMRMTPSEAINAATLNGAYAMGLSATHGSITKGKVANILITSPLESFQELPYSFGHNLIWKVLIGGEEIA